jgi:hypothetical protein
MHFVIVAGVGPQSAKALLTIAENGEAALLAALAVGLVSCEEASSGCVTLADRAKPRPDAQLSNDRSFALYR